MWSLPKTALYISPKKEEWSCFIIGGTFDGKKPFSILSSPKQFDSTYLRAQNRKMTKTARKMLPPNMILLFPPCMLRLLELNWHKPTNRCFFHLKKKKKVTKNSQAKVDNFSETQGQKNGRVISFSVFYWFKQMKPHYKASLLRLLIDELSYCRYEKRDILSTDEQH